MTVIQLLIYYSLHKVLDPRIKLKYYKDNNWGESFISSACRTITNIYTSDYSPRLENRLPEISQEDDLIIHIYKRQRIDQGSELQQYLEGPVTPEKTDILQWWKVMLNSCFSCLPRAPMLDVLLFCCSRSLDYMTDKLVHLFL